MTAKLPDVVRRKLIICAGLRIARGRGGWASMTRVKIARECHCSEALVNRYFGTMDKARTAIMKEAIKTELWDVVAQGIACKEPACDRLSPLAKHKALSSL